MSDEDEGYFGAAQPVADAIAKPFKWFYDKATELPEEKGADNPAGYFDLGGDYINTNWFKVKR